ncbi:glycosyl transferase family 11 domain-containing protein [Ditylenchus destructor]|uniref:Glycosyl transferase family 11 domain-containing protein n=1 Tax=Ditylenchus destructor TaxID=166010 RepID=A0AAD4R4I2_9BILA|nr:glycosyl transferase family 11 domain-containing protein [Ditylenchus destructor]
MWRFASLYAIGKQIGRTPYFDVSVRCMLRAVQEAEDTFPEYARLLRFERRGETGRVLVDFAKHCCKFDDLGKLKGIEDDYIQLSADHLQSYHYFENMNDEIRRIFAFSQEVKKITGDYAKRLFGDDESSHKLCVYTRRGDFIQYNTHSKLNFTEKAMEYATRVLKGKFGDVSVVLLGEDKPFLKNVTYNKKMTHAVHIPKSMSRGEDLCFAVTQCNSLLLTVPASTFGWWIGYLMNIQQATPTKDASGYVFYNSNFFLEDSFHGYRNYFPEWIPLRLLPSNAIVEM